MAFTSAKFVRRYPCLHDLMCNLSNFEQCDLFRNICVLLRRAALIMFNCNNAKLIEFYFFIVSVMSGCLICRLIYNFVKTLETTSYIPHVIL